MRVFIEANWKLAGELGWARQQERAIKGMKAKTDKMRLKEEENEKKRPKIGGEEVEVP